MGPQNAGLPPQTVFVLTISALTLVFLTACHKPETETPSYPLERLEPAASTTLTTTEHSFSVQAAIAPQGFFDAHPVYLGRGFIEQDHQPSATPSVVLSHGLWEQLGASPGAVGSTVLLHGEQHTILGITVKDPSLEAKADLLLPLSGS